MPPPVPVRRARVMTTKMEKTSFFYGGFGSMAVNAARPTASKIFIRCCSLVAHL